MSRNEINRMLMMNNLKHNKKRNIGLLNEFFAKYIAYCILNQKDNELNKTKKIYSKFMANEKSELVREHHIFDTLYTTRVTDKEAAYSLLKTLKEYVVKQDIKNLNDEKTKLLHEINNQLKDNSFFEQEVPDYRTQAMIQTLINCWRDSSSDNMEAVKGAVLLEEQVVQHLISKPKEVEFDQSLLEYGDDEINGLVFNIMLEKFNKHYGSVLSEEQKELLNLYMFSGKESIKESLIKKIETLKEETVQLLNKEVYSNYENKQLVKKHESMVSLLNESQYSNVRENLVNNDDMITFFLSVSKLKEELLSEDMSKNNKREGDNK